MMDEIDQQIHSAVMQNNEKAAAKDTPMIEEALKKVIKEGLLLKEVLGFSPKIIEQIYEYGYLLFQSGKFKEALEVFTILRKIDNENKRYTFAIAATHHQMKHYAEAVGNYMMYQALDQTNPLPYYHLFDCFSKLNQPALAFNALMSARRLAENDPQHTKLKNKIDMEITRLKLSTENLQEKQKTHTNTE